jgi:hypothetical protein
VRLDVNVVTAGDQRDQAGNALGSDMRSNRRPQSFQAGLCQFGSHRVPALSVLEGVRATA